MRVLLRGCACFALGLVLSALLLLGLMFGGQFGLIDALLASGQPLGQLGLALLPADFWSGLTGVADAAHNPSVLSFLALCVALGQSALLLALGFYRLWYRS